jgi:hypothetical protein
MKELKEKYPLLKETNYLRYKKLNYKKLEEILKNHNVFDRLYQDEVKTYFNSINRFLILQDHLKTKLPFEWVEYIGNPNYFELTRNNKKLFYEKIKSGFYQITHYNLKGVPKVIELVDKIDTFETYEEYKFRITEELKEEFKKFELVK